MAHEQVPSLRFSRVFDACYTRKSGEYSLMEDTSIEEVWVQHRRLGHHDVVFGDVSIRMPTYGSVLSSGC